MPVKDILGNVAVDIAPEVEVLEGLVLVVGLQKRGVIILTVTDHKKVAGHTRTVGTDGHLCRTVVDRHRVTEAIQEETNKRSANIAGTDEGRHLLRARELHEKRRVVTTLVTDITSRKMTLSAI